MKRIYGNFATKEGRTNNQKKLGATEKRIDSGKWMKEETSQRKKDAPPDSQEHQSNEYWLIVNQILFPFGDRLGVVWFVLIYE